MAPSSRHVPLAVRAVWQPSPATRELPVVQPRSVGCRLEAHLRAWHGAWPPRAEFDLTVWPGRDQPGWDGGVWPGLGVESPRGSVRSRSSAIVPDLCLTRAVFRWAAGPFAGPEIGEWVDRTDPRLPPRLRPFNGGVLVAWDGAGRAAAGAGIKRHNAHGHELAVGMEPAHRGRGLARRLVAQAARRILADGAVPLYLHHPANAASARMATAAGFPDRGWRVLGLLPEVYPTR